MPSTSTVTAQVPTKGLKDRESLQLVKVMSHDSGGDEPDGTRFHHAPQNGK